MSTDPISPDPMSRVRRRALTALRLGAIAALGVVSAFALLPGSAGGAHANRAVAQLTLPPITTIIHLPLTYTVSLTTSGPGTVSSSPSGLACAANATCSGSFAIGTPVTLTASPGSILDVFDGWGGACSGTGTCTVSSAATVTAPFHFRSIITTVITTLPITTTPITTTPVSSFLLSVATHGSGTVTSSPAGINCTATCTANFSGTVSLHATPASGYELTSWSGGGCSGTAPTCSVSVAATVTVTFSPIESTSTSTATTTPATTTSASALPVIATTPTTTAFVPPTLVTLAVAVTGSGTVTGKVAGAGKGIACGARGSTCFGSYTPGTKITLKAGAATGFRFTGWSGGCSGSGLTCLVSVKRAASVSAKFSPIPHAAILPVEIDAAAFSVQWKASVGTGKLLVHGRIARSAEVQVRLSRSGGAPLLTERLSLSSGPFRLTLKLEPGLQLLPGGFVITISGHSGSLVVPPQVKTLSLPAPAEGVVDRAFASAFANSHPAATLHASGRAAFVHFEFQSQPRSGKQLTVAWYRPNGQLLGVAPKARAADVTSSISSGENLPPGVWHVDLRVGSTLVKRIEIQVK